MFTFFLIFNNRKIHLTNSVLDHIDGFLHQSIVQIYSVLADGILTTEIIPDHGSLLVHVLRTLTLMYLSIFFIQSLHSSICDRVFAVWRHCYLLLMNLWISLSGNGNTG